MTPLRIRLREFRLDAGLSQAELAARSGVRQASISALETGKARRFDAVTVERLAAVLGVSPHELFETVPGRRGP